MDNNYPPDMDLDRVNPPDETSDCEWCDKPTDECECNN